MCLTKLFFIQLPCEENTSECMLKNVELLKFLSELKLISMLKKINEKIRGHFCIIAYNKENSTRLHLFQREIKSVTRHPEINELIPDFVNNFKYIASINLSESIEIPDIYNFKCIKKCDSIVRPFDETPEYEVNPDREIRVDLEFYYKYYFYSAGDLDIVQDFFESYSSFSNVVENLENLYSGLWFSYNDIRWQIALVSLVYTNYSDFGRNICRIKTEDFTFGNKLNFYAKKYNSRNIIEKDYLKYLDISCETCGNTTPNFFYHNPICGDLCSGCYEKKREYENNRRIYYKKLVLLQGKRVVFKKRLEETKKHLENLKIQKLIGRKKTRLMEKSIRELSRTNILQKTECGICLDSLANKPEPDSDCLDSEEIKLRQISTGQCGHCFHSQCIENIGAPKCPICRRYTNFIPLYLNP